MFRRWLYDTKSCVSGRWGTTTVVRHVEGPLGDSGEVFGEDSRRILRGGRGLGVVVVSTNVTNTGSRFYDALGSCFGCWSWGVHRLNVAWSSLCGHTTALGRDLYKKGLCRVWKPQ